ncbi:NupC/NupG family nucleoside CNT transporter [Salinivibrio sp. IB872]|uniref:NupC/NupG family nucleoside CNT transporter n=1 Tax=Salinivibrio sp. IB872 TaxID=1766123 RepID=UPI0009848ABD|nr:NupC/NupG family nucleoside CNT transporter [Salinivibrio sp. IB872]OOF26262.1 nucleoside transporter NupC [Salinivibrio sp. IB872]
MQFGIGLLGISVLFLIAIGFSENRRAINWRTVGGAFIIQIAFAGFIISVPLGQRILANASEAVSAIISFGDIGAEFLFGDLAKFKLGFIFAFNVLPTIVFFSALIAVLYHLGIMAWIIRLIGGVLRRVLGTSRTESMSATANIFVGSVEAPLVVRPFLASMTRSELFAVMVGGLASVAGGTMVGYAGLGVEMKYLIAAAFMSAPAGLMMAKIMVPQTEAPISHTQAQAEQDNHDKPVNLIDAGTQGALSGLQIAMAVGASLLAVISMIALINGGLGKLGPMINMPQLSLEWIFGYVFAPIAWLIGIPWGEAMTAGTLIGKKIAVNEFVAFADFMNLKGALSPHSQAIVTFALCGFANLTSIAMLMGGLGGIVPERRGDIAKLGMRAILAATLANLMSATLAGLYLTL